LKGGVPQHVARKPRTALEYVLKNCSRAVPYEELIQEIWGKDESDKTKDDVRKTVRHCFKSLNYKGHFFIKTVPQYGYLFEHFPGETSPQPYVEPVRTSGDTARQPSVETDDELDGEEKFCRTPLGNISSKLLFCYPGGHVNAVRLYGRGRSYVSPERLFLE